MKLSILTISLIVTFIPFSLLSNTATSTPVYDIDGEPLTPGTGYYILPLIRGRGGGVKNYWNGSCPYYVAQANSEVDRGRPVQFYPVNPDEETIPLSTDLNIEFYDLITVCIQQYVWQLGDPVGDSGSQYVTAGGVLENPGEETVNRWFKIETHPDGDYKLVFCLTVCETCRPVCGDIGVLSQGGTRFLGLSDNPFRVCFARTLED
ncbi:Kunitz-type trypsin inhibitor [Rhynchospora pubera]|uniref:Kunitz-type trypsin inhibitor n=1 Tax=Rhynchospora pubera TaxID=906938 RepID=A0AAV8HV72_9POAL|nr:Kunitz-type trypsin inhibitor [Rhynchospora pubera]